MLLPFPLTPQQRLRAAAVRLHQAVQQQAAAVAAWRAELDKLKDVVAGLGSSLATVQGSLADAHNSAAQAHERSVNTVAMLDASIKGVR